MIFIEHHRNIYFLKTHKINPNNFTFLVNFHVMRNRKEKWTNIALFSLRFISFDEYLQYYK